MGALGASLLAKSIDFVEDNAVKLTLQSFFILLSFGVSEERPHRFFTFANELTHDFRSIDDLWLYLEQLTDFPSDKSLSCPRRPVE
jgi:hypothetical protein